MSWQLITPCPRCKSDVMFTCDGPACDSHVTHGIPSWWTVGSAPPDGADSSQGDLYCSVTCKERAVELATTG